MLKRSDLYKIFEDYNDTRSRLYEEGAPAKDYGFRVTSGTSGKEPLFRIAYYPGHFIPRFKDSRRSVLLFGSKYTQLLNLLFFTKDEKIDDSQALVLEAKDLNAKLGKILSEFAPEKLIGFPSFIRKAVESIPEELQLPVHTIFLVGELYTKELEEVLERRFPGVRVITHYANSEIGGIGVSCDQLKKNQYHPIRGVELFVVTPNKEGVGELVVSRKGGDLEFEDYYTGDYAQLLKKECACGKTKSFEVVGRAGYDYVKVAGAQLYRTELERAMSEVSDYVRDFHVEVRTKEKSEKTYGHITFLVVPKKCFSFTKTHKGF